MDEEKALTIIKQVLDGALKGGIIGTIEQAEIVSIAYRYISTSVRSSMQVQATQKIADVKN